MDAWSKSYEDILIRGDPSLASKSPESKARLKALVKEMEIAKGAAKYQECADWIGCIAQNLQTCIQNGDGWFGNPEAHYALVVDALKTEVGDDIVWNYAEPPTAIADGLDDDEDLAVDDDDLLEMFEE